MKRWLFNMAVVLLSVLCVAVGVLWVESYDYAGNGIGYQIVSSAGPASPTLYQQRWYTFGIVNGKIILTHGQTVDNQPVIPIDKPRWFLLHHMNLAGFQTDLSLRAGWCFPTYHIAAASPGGIGGTLDAWAMPFWAIFALSVMLSLPWLVLSMRRKHTHRRRIKRGLCVTCGYDLRASPDRCPECGTPIPADFVRNPLA